MIDIITLDYESYWSTSYSLSKMSPLEYVLGDEFETLSCAIKVNGYPTDVCFGHDAIAKAFHSIRGTISGGMLIAHNNLGFDSYISAYVFGLKPKMWGCTQAMARPLHAKTVGLSLAKLVQHYGLGVKDNSVLMQTRGKHLADFTEVELKDMATYNKADTDQCYALFRKLLPFSSSAELWQIDALTRMRVEPAFETDTPMLEVALSMERDQKRKSVLRLAQHLRKTEQGSDAVTAATTVEEVEEAVRVELASAPKFAALLESLGIEVPMKASPSNPDKQVPALAKTDEAYVNLQFHDDPVVAAATRARLAVKSTLLETRIDKFLTATRLTGGKLPVPLQYCGADTTGRDSGCLTGDTQILVYDDSTDSICHKPIVEVRSADLVWDGEEFVAHGGVVFSGYAEVITWDGVTGTKDHVVFTEVGEISLSDALARGVPIQTAAHPAQHRVDAARKHADHHKE